MVSFVNLQSISMRDARGHVGKMRYYYTFDDAVTAGPDNASAQCDRINLALAAASNAAITHIGGMAGRLFMPNNYGTAAQFADAEDKARLVYLMGPASGPTVDFVLTAIEIPAPKLAIFYADQETVNGASALVIAINTQLAAIDATGGRLTTRGGNVFVNFVGGYRNRRKLQRKLTLWTKSANLDEPEE
jgi:hypothetical protein